MRKHALHVFLACLMVQPAGTVTAGDVTGVVTRPSAEPQAIKKVDRYRSRSGNMKGVDPDCACQPHLYAVVHLTSDTLPAAKPVAPKPRMSQKDMMFSPAVMAVSVGTTVEFPNLDSYFHNVFSYSSTKKFDLGRYPQGKSQEVTFDKPGLVKVFCEIHYSMRAYIHVFESPYFAVSNEKGEFTIPAVAPGRYTMHIWQENLPELTEEIVVPSDSVFVAVP